MPDTATAFRLPRPNHPASHHFVVVDNAPVFEYDLKEYEGEGGRALIVVEPRRRDGAPQAPFVRFGKRVIPGLSETFNDPVIVVHESHADGTEMWAVTQDMPFPVFDQKDPATRALLEKIEADARSGDAPAEQAVQHAVQMAVMAGLLKPSGMQVRKVLAEILPAAVPELMTDLFSHHVEPPEEPAVTTAIGWAAAAETEGRGRRPRTTRHAPIPRVPLVRPQYYGFDGDVAGL